MIITIDLKKDSEDDIREVIDFLRKHIGDVEEPLPQENISNEQLSQTDTAQEQEPQQVSENSPTQENNSQTPEVQELSETADNSQNDDHKDSFIGQNVQAPENQSQEESSQVQQESVPNQDSQNVSSPVNQPVDDNPAVQQEDNSVQPEQNNSSKQNEQQHEQPSEDLEKNGKTAQAEYGTATAALMGLNNSTIPSNMPLLDLNNLDNNDKDEDEDITHNDLGLDIVPY